MNLKYLTENILPQREIEFENGDNLATANPIYVVFDLAANIIEGHTSMYCSTNNKGKECEYLYADYNDCHDEIEFFESTDGLKNPEPVTRFYTDRFVAFFLTRKAAKDYLSYQSHNMSNEAYIYVFSTGYGNIEMNNLDL